MQGALVGHIAGLHSTSFAHGDLPYYLDLLRQHAAGVFAFVLTYSVDIFLIQSTYSLYSRMPDVILKKCVHPILMVPSSILAAKHYVSL